MSRIISLLDSINSAKVQAKYEREVFALRVFKAEEAKLNIVSRAGLVDHRHRFMRISDSIRRVSKMAEMASTRSLTQVITLSGKESCREHASKAQMPRYGQAGAGLARFDPLQNTSYWLGQN